MIKQNKLLAAATGATVLLGSSGVANAVTFETEDYTFTVNGNVNSRYIYTNCDETPGAVNGALLCATGPGQEEEDSSISTGLLPGAIVFGADTTQNGLDVGATVGIFFGTATNDPSGFPTGAPNGPNLRSTTLGGSTALGTGQVDLRQAFLTFGNDAIGEVKIGRDFGLFGFDAIINDNSIQGAGTSSLFTARGPAFTTLAQIGFGYVFVDEFPQITYTTPDIGGLQGTIGVFDPFDAAALAFDPNTGDALSAASTGSTKGFPGAEYKLRYDFPEVGGLFSGFVSTSGIYEKHELEVADTDGLLDADGNPATVPPAGVNGTQSEDAWAVDVVANVTVAGLNLHATYYTGEGIGITALFFDGFDAQGNTRDSDGYLGQLSYTIPATNTKIGASYGRSNLDSNDVDLGTGLVDQQESYTAGIYHNLTPTLTLSTEYTNSRATSNVGDVIETSSINVGGFLAF